jgi:ArsR family transcriptional regulator
MDLAQIYKALSEEARLRILALLMRHGELCVCDVEAALDATQSKTSRHMRYLAQAGLVRDRREGVRMYYRIVEAPDPDRARVLDGVRAFAGEAWRWESEERRLQAWLLRKALAAAADPVALR